MSSVVAVGLVVQAQGPHCEPNRHMVSGTKVASIHIAPMLKFLAQRMCIRSHIDSALVERVIIYLTVVAVVYV